MILVDTDVWIDHIARPEPSLVNLLSHGLVLAHPFVIGEIALGSLRARAAILGDLARLPEAVLPFDDEVFAYIERHRLHGLGIGYVDAHLLTAAQLTASATLWTRDRRLHAVAARLGISADLETRRTQ